MATLRTATVADVPAVAHIAATSPDDSALWTYPTWCSFSSKIHPLMVRSVAGLLKDRKHLLRVAEMDGQVVGYAAWVQRERVGEEVRTVDLAEGYDHDEIDALIAKFDPPSNPAPKFAAFLPPLPSHQAASTALRARQSPEPCLALPSTQLLILGVLHTSQRSGIGSALVSEGLPSSPTYILSPSAAKLPVFVTGEGRALKFYATLGFRAIKGTWNVFNGEGELLEREEGTGLEDGDGEGMVAAQMVYIPAGEEVAIKGVRYTSKGAQ